MGGGAIWSGRLEVVGGGWVCQGLVGCVRLGQGVVRGGWGVEGGRLVVGEGGVGEFGVGEFFEGEGELVVGPGGVVGVGGDLVGRGAAELFDGVEELAGGVVERAFVEFVEADEGGVGEELGGGVDEAVGGAGLDSVEGSERAFACEGFEALAGELDDAHGVFGDGGLGDFGPVGFEREEVVVDGGVGDVEVLGDLAEGESLVAELVGLEGASASARGEGHDVALSFW